jgi:GT2 family glycosyltransferase
MLGVITINYNLHQHTIPCIHSILNSDYKNIHIFLVDNGSEHKDYSILSDEFGENRIVTLLRIDTNCGYVGGVNFGIKTALKTNPEFLLIMNNDTIIDRGAIRHMVNALQRHNSKAIVTGKVFYYDQPDILQHTGALFKNHKFLSTEYPGKNIKDIGQFNQELERDSLDDVFWMFPSQLIDEIGYYSCYFYLYAEQGDFARRAYKNGYKLIYTPKAKIWHKESLTTGGGDSKSLKIMYWRGQGSFIFLARHLKWYYFTFWFFRQVPLVLLKSLVLKNPKLRKASRAMLQGYLYGLRWLFIRNENKGYNPYL